MGIDMVATNDMVAKCCRLSCDILTDDLYTFFFINERRCVIIFF